MEECWPTHAVYRRVCGDLIGKTIEKIDADTTEKVMEKLLKEKIVTKAK
jgi:hypothetical protein